MTDITLEQRARVLLAAECRAEKMGPVATAIEQGMHVSGFADIALRAIEEALRPSAGADWQPIETAPKDGTDILIAGGTYSVRDYQDLKFSGVGIAFWDRDHWHGNEANAHDEWCRHQPTHWQPIPAAPRHETGEGS